MTIKLSMPSSEQQLKPRITVIGVGGAGGNAVNNMINTNLEGVDFLVCNTDSQALEQSVAENKLQLGVSITQGLGAGARPEVGQAAAEEVLDTILDQVVGSHMCFVTAGMGGGTGTGAAPVIARAARENGMLTVGVVTKPFHFEGAQRMRVAEQGIEELAQYVDTLIIIPNQNLFRIANEKTTFAEAFNMADEVLNSGVRGVTDLMVMPGLINLDFADIRTVMSEMGKAMMGTGEAEGDTRAIDAAESAISNPLLDDITMEGARGVLINITGGPDITLFEVDEAANRIRQEVDENANILFGSTFEEEMEGKIRVSVVATGIEANAAAQPLPQSRPLTEAIARPMPSMGTEPDEDAAMEPTPIEKAVEAAKLDDSDEDMASDAVPAMPSFQSEAHEPVDALQMLGEDDGSSSEQSSILDEAVAATQSLETSSEPPGRDPFIPPEPVDVSEPVDADQYPDPFSEADFANARNDLDQPRKKKRPSLFKRLTGAARREEEAERTAMPAPVPAVAEQPEPVAAATEMPPMPAAIEEPAPQPAMEPDPEPETEMEPAAEKESASVSFLRREDVLTPESAPIPTPTAQPEPAPAAPAPAPMPKPAAAAPAATAPAPMPTPVPQPESDQFSLSQADEEMLEIPAFLRRQAN
ncbi:MAG: cell division protein FtsZ [Rhodospirillaceae bacterium]|nr:cell division protein FtsZ [Rhodospirillaceae bacterium]